ncbi:MAG TPA: hypothetical protein VF808_02895 [Ktedonobacterales bacterium]
MSQKPQSPQTAAVIKEEEARTELLATLAAARELGPEMDDTLSGRFVEQFNKLFPDSARDNARLRSDVQTLLVSARGHGSDADAARVKDFLSRAMAPQTFLPVIARPAGPPMRGQAGQYIPMAVCAAIIVGIVLASGGHAAWLLFWLLPMLFWSTRGRRRMRYRRYGYWDGYGPNLPRTDARRQLPPDDGPEMV